LLTSLKHTISEFDEELSLNPTSAISIQDQLSQMLEAIGELTEEDKE